MPRIPQYEPGQIPRRNVPEIGTPRATPGVFGAGQAELLGQVGQAVSQFGEIAMKYAAYEERKLNKSLARDALNQAQMDADLFLYGDGTEENRGLYGRQGKDVANVIEDAQKEFERIKREKTKDLADQYAKELFEASYGDYVANNLNSLSRFRAGQIERYHQDTLDAQNLILMDEAVKNRNDEGAVNRSIGDISANIREKYRGMGADVQEARVAEAKTLLHSKVLDAIGDDSPEAAMGYLKKYWKDIDPVLREKVEAGLQKEIDKNKTFYDALKISQSGKDLEAQLAEADKADNPEEVRRLVKQRYKDKKDLEAIKQATFEEAEFKKVQADPLRYDPPLSKITSGSYKAMMDYKRQAVAQAKAQSGVGDPPKTDWNVYYDLKAKILSGDLTTGALFKYTPKLHPTQWNELYDDIQKARKDSGKVYKLRNPYQYAQDVAGSIKAMTITTKDDEDEREEKRLRRHRFFSEWERRIQQLPEEERTEQNMYEIANKLLTPVTDYKGWDTDYFRFEMPYLEEKTQRRIKEKNLPESVKLFAKQKADIEYKYNEDHGRDLYHVKVGRALYLFDDEGEEVEWYEVVQ